MEKDVVDILLRIESSVTRIDERTLNQEKSFCDLGKRVKVLEEKQSIEEGEDKVKSRNGLVVWSLAEITFGAFVGWMASKFGK